MWIRERCLWRARLFSTGPSFGHGLILSLHAIVDVVCPCVPGLVHIIDVLFETKHTGNAGSKGEDDSGDNFCGVWHAREIQLDLAERCSGTKSSF